MMDERNARRRAERIRRVLATMCAQVTNGRAPGSRLRLPPCAVVTAVALLMASATMGPHRVVAGDSSDATLEPLEIQTSHLPGAQVDVPYTSTLVASGGTGVALTWHVVDGALPSGITLDGRDGAERLWDGEWQVVGANPLTECSGLAASAANPGILWVHDDSSGAPAVYAMREDGSVAHTYRVVAFNNEPSYDGPFAIDIEDIALGPGPSDDTEYLYLGDFGDNLAARGPPDDGPRILRLIEPTVGGVDGGTTDVEVDAFSFVYPSDGALQSRHDAEVLLVDWDSGTPYVVTKRHGLGSGYVYKFPMPLDSAWTSSQPTTLIAVGGGPIVTPIWPTAGDASRDGQRVVLRTYTAQAFEYVRPMGGGFDDIFGSTEPAHVNAYAAPSGPQHEAIGYGGDGTTLYTATEGQTTPIHRVDAGRGVTTTVIMGTPSRAGAHAFTVEVRDSSGASSSRALTLTVGREPPATQLFLPWLLAF